MGLNSTASDSLETFDRVDKQHFNQATEGFVISCCLSNYPQGQGHSSNFSHTLSMCSFPVCLKHLQSTLTLVYGSPMTIRLRRHYPKLNYLRHYCYMQLLHDWWYWFPEDSLGAWRVLFGCASQLRLLLQCDLRYVIVTPEFLRTLHGMRTPMRLVMILQLFMVDFVSSRDWASSVPSSAKNLIEGQVAGYMNSFIDIPAL